MYEIDLQQLEFIDSTLREILKDVEGKFGNLMITSLYRIGDTGVHGTLPLRGIDIRCRDKMSGRVITMWVNNRWLYDYERPSIGVALAHGEDDNYHLHFQTHRNTKKG